MSENGTQNIHVKSMKRIITPREIDEQLPINGAAAETVLQSREEVRRVLQGEDDRLMVVIGPCSIHDGKAAMEFARFIAEMRAEYGDRLLIVMRTYFEKPRTTVGWQGLISEPNLDGVFDIEKGLLISRKLLIDINQLGVPCATELLDPLVPPYIAGAISWATLGARTTESQTHRKMGSGLSMSLGMKNATNGDMQIAINAMHAAAGEQAFLGIDADGRVSTVNTTGHTNCNLVLRGGDQPNYHPMILEQASRMLAAAGLNTRLVIDCSHANCGKQHERQGIVCREVTDQRITNGNIAALMLECNIHPGRQDIPENLDALKYGVSITDPCIGMEEGAQLLAFMHHALGEVLA